MTETGNIHCENDKYKVSFLGSIRKKDILDGKVGKLFKTGTERIRADHTSFKFMSDTYEVEFRDFIKPTISKHMMQMNGFKLINLLD